FRTNSLFTGSSVRAGHGMANSLFPIFKKPPNDSTAYAMRPEFTSIIRSSIFPRLSPAAFLTLSLVIELLESTLGYFVFSMLNFLNLKCTISENREGQHRHSRKELLSIVWCTSASQVQRFANTLIVLRTTKTQRHKGRAHTGFFVPAARKKSSE